MTPHSGTSNRWPVKPTTSYGGVVLRDGSEGVEVALIKPSGKDDVWALPKGGKEPGETPEEAALREVAEETGLDAEIVEPLDAVTYWFSWAPERVRYRKTVRFFLMRATGGRPEPVHTDEVSEVRFFPLSDAPATYPSERDVLRAVLERTG